MSTIKIYQLKQFPAFHMHRFLSWDRLHKYGLKFDIENYDKVYEYVSDNVNLDNIYVKFQYNKPKDFRGHSLSVSDVIMINNKMYYVDNFGFKKI